MAFYGIGSMKISDAYAKVGSYFTGAAEYARNSVHEFAKKQLAAPEIVSVDDKKTKIGKDAMFLVCAGTALWAVCKIIAAIASRIGIICLVGGFIAGLCSACGNNIVKGDPSRSFFAWVSAATTPVDPAPGKSDTPVNTAASTGKKDLIIPDNVADNIETN
jgi:hypothetical protein